MLSLRLKGSVKLFWDCPAASYIGPGIILVGFSSIGNVFSMGVFTFSGARTGYGLADFLTGRLATFRQASPNFNRVKKVTPSLYATDSWKATRKR